MRIPSLILTVILYSFGPLSVWAQTAGKPAPLGAFSSGPAGTYTQSPNFAPEPGRKIDLEPFFLLHGKEGQFRVERVIVTVELGAATEPAGFDPNAPVFRKTLYELLTAPQGEAALCSQALKELQGQWGQEAVRSIALSRSFLITR